MPIDFQGRVAIVTGAGAGLGRSHALLLASRGARVVVNDLGGTLDGTGSSAKAADQVVAEIVAAGGVAVANYDSVSEAGAAANIVRTAMDAFGRVDILINNAGILRDKTFAKMELSDFETVVDVHFLGSAYVTKAAWPVMQQQNYGRIVMTSSNAGLYGNFGQANYGGAKCAVVGLMNVLKQEGGKYGIQVNTIAPVAATRMTEALLPPQLLKHLKPEYVSQAVAYLCAEACKANGDIIAAGAGYYAKIQLMESEGMFFGVDANVSVDDIAANYAKITDMAKPRGFASSMDEVAHIAKPFVGG